MTGRTGVSASVGLGVCLALSAVAAPLAMHAQSGPDCSITPRVAGNPDDVCRKAADIFAFVVPQVGVALAGGNSILGEGGTLGGWGKRSLTVRFTAVDGRVPTRNVPVTLGRANAVSDDFGAKRTAVPMPSLDLALGLWAGVPMGLTNVGGIDALLGVNAVPSLTSNDFELNPQTRAYAFSYGVRIGALQESSLVPGVSVSWLRRRIPTLDASYTPANDTLLVSDASLSSTALRLVASKRFTFLGVAAGIGRDKIEGETVLRAVVNETLVGIPARTDVSFPTLRESVSRNTAFINGTLGLGVVRFVLEYGRSSAGSTRQTLNTFGDRRANEAYTYGSFGLTVRF